MPFDTAEDSDLFYRHIIHNDFNAFFTMHGAYGYPLEGLKLIWDCLHPCANMRPSLSIIEQNAFIANAPTKLDDSLKEELIKYLPGPSAV